MNLQIINAEAVAGLRQLPAESVQCCVTSPPYWGLRSYLPAGHQLKALEIGTEKSPQEFAAKLVAVFAEVWRVLKPDGTLWLNLGDSYAANSKDRTPSQAIAKTTLNGSTKTQCASLVQPRKIVGGLKQKDLAGIPWLVAFALREAGWYLRSDIIWVKPNCMPESVTDRPTRSHEYLFLLTKSQRYYYDHEAIKEPPSPELVKQVEEGYNGKAIKDYLGSNVQDASATKARIISGHRHRIDKQRCHSRRHCGSNEKWDALNPQEQALLGRNKRDVWTVSPASYPESHFATFPPELIKPCILAGSKPGDVVLDPFGGSGTTGEVALELGRKAVLIELNPDYIPLIEQRTFITPGLAIA
jgi:DNA modification methylase